MVTGYLQGSPLSVNSLIHIPGFGDFQMSHIEAPEDPYPIEYRSEKRRPGYQVEMKDGAKPANILQIADPEKQVSIYAFL